MLQRGSYQLGNASESRDNAFTCNLPLALWIYGKQISKGIHFNEETSASVVFVHYTLMHVFLTTAHMGWMFEAVLN